MKEFNFNIKKVMNKAIEYASIYFPKFTENHLTAQTVFWEDNSFQIKVFSVRDKKIRYMILYDSVNNVFEHFVLVYVNKNIREKSIHYEKIT